MQLNIASSTTAIIAFDGQVKNNAQIQLENVLITHKPCLSRSVAIDDVSITQGLYPKSGDHTTNTAQGKYLRVRVLVRTNRRPFITPSGFNNSNLKDARKHCSCLSLILI